MPFLTELFFLDNFESIKMAFLAELKSVSSYQLSVIGYSPFSIDLKYFHTKQSRFVAGADCSAKY